MIIGRVTWTGAREAQERLQKRVLRLTGRDPQMYGDVQKVVFTSTVQNFTSGGRPGWRKRSPGYEAWAMKKYGTFWPPLLMTSKLFETTTRSIMQPWEHRGAIHRLNIKSIWYGLCHQHGATVSRNGKTYPLPKRPYVLIHADERKHISAIIKKHLRMNHG